MGIPEEALSFPPIAEGKTKRIFEMTDGLARVIVVSKDDITAGDGAKHDIIDGKAKLANQTTCNVFRLLKDCGIPVAFEEEFASSDIPAYGFTAPKCAMLPYEVVVRREAHGSYLKRAPHLAKGHIFPQLVLEFYLKTSGKKWKNHELVCDDPLMIYDAAGTLGHPYNPKQPNLPHTPAQPFLVLPGKEVESRGNERVLREIMGTCAKTTFLILEKAWQLQGRKLVDFKVEFGLSPNGVLMLADVIDNDSWRVMDASGGYIDKQVYRDGGDLNEVTSKYQQVAELTSRFSLPHQQLILWRGSDKDDFNLFHGPLRKLIPGYELKTSEVTCSMHKQPARAYRMLQRLISEVPDSVLLAYVGMSNGAGPTLAANATVPVITVPASYKKFPEDVWSSLRMPSNVPVMTVLNPANAVLAALQILALRNPLIYATLRFDQEKRLTEI